MNANMEGRNISSIKSLMTVFLVLILKINLQHSIYTNLRYSCSKRRPWLTKANRVTEPWIMEISDSTNPSFSFF